jgi:hypothetical protein
VIFSQKSVAFCASHADDDPKWNRLAIRTVGPRITVRLNGVLVTDDDAGALDDTAHQKRRVGLRDHRALQIHKNDRLRMRFGDVEIAEAPCRQDRARASPVACGLPRATTGRRMRR